jgi:HAD superfamily hydrolase (TIGR01490 family)
MQHCIKQWFTDMLNANYFFNAATMARLHAHQRNQDIVLIVSGSFYNAVEIVTNHLGVNHIICNKLTSKNNVYTGELDQGPIIGEGKVQAICRYLKAHNIIGTITHAYGDHPSDIPMLSLAQTPVAVGNHAELIAWAEPRCWDRLDNTQTIDVI